MNAQQKNRLRPDLEAVEGRCLLAAGPLAALSAAHAPAAVDHRPIPGRIDVDGAPVRQSVAVGTNDVVSARSWKSAGASAYGPGLYGNRTACGQTLTRDTVGVAHRSLRCGTQLKFLGRSGQVVKAKVIDRGPYVHGRTFDLTEATVKKLGYASARDFGVRTVRWDYA